MEMETEEQQLVGVVDLVEQILLRLPIKDLIRFVCVSKSWYSLIFSYEFSHKYLKFQANNNNNNKLNLMLHGTHGSFHSISYDYSNCRISAPTPTQLDNQNQPLLVNFIGSQEFTIVGSCDGLLLVAVTTPEVHGARAIYIWNPTTRVYKVLPKLVTTPGSFRSKVFGFGRVPTTDNNYKVVFLETISSTQEDTNLFKVHLYTTHTDSWKTLPYTIPYYSTFCSSSLRMELAYDNLHYVPEVDHCFQSDPIISFDLKDDKFRVLTHPRCDQFPTLGLISALNGGLVALTESRDDKLFCLSMMENFGKEDEHWAKKYCLNHPATIDYPNVFFNSVLGIRQDGQILLSTQSYCYLPSNPNFISPCVVCYNTNTNRAETLYQHSYFWPLPVVYVESLISPYSTDDRVEGREGKFKRRRTCLQRCTQLALISTSS